MKNFVKVDENNIVIDSIVIPDVDNGQKLYSPLNIQFTPANSLTLKERRALKKIKFFKKN